MLGLASETMGKLIEEWPALTQASCQQLSVQVVAH